ncbi:FAD-binding protein [Xylanimonas oleitrophica]|uniref:L-aspartate oxidase n=1 Tax=Xylanimonas oleitrophica TaxID=2607479 RepID=UPI001FECADAD
MAGLVAAHRASRHHEVVLVTKADLAESSTRYAQGGIAVAMFPEDSVEAHVADTLAAGAGTCDEAAVRVLCGDGPRRVRDLLDLGVELDRVAGPGSELARGQEAAHSARRIVHAGGDATGLAVELGLLRAVRSTAVEVHEHTALRDLLLAPGPGGAPHVVGVRALGPAGEEIEIRADAVVLATGGAGRLYPHTTNPAVATGDGVAAVLRAGAVVQDLEMYQFHPTALAVPGTPLVSEAVRGEGAVLRDESGRRFMLDVHPDAELAPRDVVARGIAAAMTAQGGRPVLLDATALGRERLAARFPSITATVAAHGLDWAAEPVPVTPAAHYWMGGVRTDTWGRTSLPGLWAVGEVACTGVHGANRLASNSLLESLVFAWRAAEAIDAAGTGGTGGADGTDAAGTAGAVRDLPGSLADAGTGTGTGASTGPAEPFSRAALQTTLWELVGLERDETGLAEAARRIDAWRAAVAGPGSTATPGTEQALPGVSAAPPGPVTALEDRNLLDVAHAVVAAARARTESRGAHARRDAPRLDPAQAVPTAWAWPTPAVPMTSPTTPTSLTAGALS